MSDDYYTKGYRLWDEFLQKWPVSRLAEMELEDYTKVGSTDTFTYWLGRKELGRPGYPDAIKFGVYARKKSDERESSEERGYSETHCWHKSLGGTPHEAFEKVREYVKQIAALAAAGDLEGIDALECKGLANVIKWKTASLYQDRQQPIMVNIFTREPLAYFTGGDAKKQSMAALQKATLERQEKGEEILEFWRRVWKQWETQNQKNQPCISAPVEMGRSALEEELLKLVRKQTSEFFEQLVMDLLGKMGYRAERLGGRNDHGVDGVIHQDALGLKLDRSYVQVKRYAANNKVGPAAIRDFAGALEFHKANTGLFVTASSFTEEASKAAEQMGKHIVLIEGGELVRLMVRYGVGCRQEGGSPVKKIDEDFFEYTPEMFGAESMGINPPPAT